jgi:hypothetical protein
MESTQDMEDDMEGGRESAGRIKTTWYRLHVWLKNELECFVMLRPQFGLFFIVINDAILIKTHWQISKQQGRKGRKKEPAKRDTRARE